MSTGEGKFVGFFGRPEIYLTACAVTKDPVGSVYTAGAIANGMLDGYFCEPNQFWKRDPNHEKALLKVYSKNPYRVSICYDNRQITKIQMPFLGHDSSDGWGELQFLIKAPAFVKLARHRSFDSRANQWVEETNLIQPKTDLGSHSYMSLRFYHQDHLPPVPDDWHFEPVYVSITGAVIMFYKIEVFWEEKEIKITATVLDENSPEIPKQLK